MTFDTHDAVKRLQGAQFTEAQAEAMTTLLRDMRGNDLAHLATKSDVASAVRDMTNAVEVAKRDLTIRLGGITMAAAAFLAAIKFFG